jgi:GntR family histidine utilization transcriptional repressor
VALNPVRKATLDIPVIRYEIEGKGQSYRHSVLSQERAVPPPGIQGGMRTEPGVKLTAPGDAASGRRQAVCVSATAGSIRTPPGIDTADLIGQSANEWLVANIPFEGGDFSFSAMTAGKREAEILACKEGEGCS